MMVLLHSNSHIKFNTRRKHSFPKRHLEDHLYTYLQLLGPENEYLQNSQETSHDYKLQTVNCTPTEETEHEFTIWDKFCTFLCFATLGIIGYFYELISQKPKDKNREEYAPLVSTFEKFYKAQVYDNYWKMHSNPIGSVPGKYVEVLHRSSDDRGQTLRLTGESTDCINLGSYNYLGFGENDGICAEKAIETLKSNGISTCTTRTTLGTSRLILELEEKTAEFLGTEDSIACAMGFATNSLNLPAIITKNCLVLSDANNHASIVLGLRLSNATIRVFKHNDMKDLERLLRQGIAYGQSGLGLPWEKIFIVAEGIYSVEGTIAKLPDLIALKKKYKAYLYMDEAHSIGALGPHGRGIVDYYNCDPNDIDILMGTYTKSFAASGGYIAGSRNFIRQLRQNSYSHTYGTVMSPPVIQQILTSMSIIMGEDGTDDGIKRIRQLKRNSRYFRQKLKQAGFIVYGHKDSPVVPTALYHPSNGIYTIVEMIKHGVATVFVGYPATPWHDSRTRFCISSAHTKEMLDHAFNVMCKIGDDIHIRNSRLPRIEGEIKY